MGRGGEGGGRIERRVLAAHAPGSPSLPPPSRHYPNPMTKQHRTGIEKVEYAESSSHSCLGVHGQIEEPLPLCFDGRDELVLRASVQCDELVVFTEMCKSAHSCRLAHQKESINYTVT